MTPDDPDDDLSGEPGDGTADGTGGEPGDGTADGPAWPVIETAVEHGNEWFTVGYDLLERPDGERARYWWIQPGDVVAVVAWSLAALHLAARGGLL